MRRVITDLQPLLTGWIQYFKLAEVKSTFEQLDEWLRRKLRRILWKQWKTPAQRHRRLRALGIGVTLTHMTAGSNRGLWAMSCSKGLQIALRNASFDLLGLPRLELAL